MRKLSLGAAAAILAFAAVPLAAGQAGKGATKLKAALNVGQEKPVPKGTKVGASGSFRATVTEMTIKWTLTYAHLTGPATAAHIHRAARGVSGPVIVPLCGTASTPSCTSPISGTTTVSAAVLADILAGKTYVNVHTDKNAGGEIRGQITKAR